jgi:nanoRNase/pAp phosphatase (c-di-AMP/oligoRNAs hydrolase)
MRRQRAIGLVTRVDIHTFKAAIIRAKKLVSTLGDTAQPDLRTHEAADQDGIGAMFALRGHLLRKGVTPRIVTGRIMPTTLPLVARLGIAEISEAEPSTGMQFVLDTSARPLLNGIAASLDPTKTMIIDHHVQDGDPIPARYKVVSGIAGSTCEMLASLIPHDDMTRNEAFALAVGIAADSERLATAERRTIRIFEALLRRANVGRHEINELADPVSDPETTLALLKDMATVKSFAINKGSKTVVVTIGLSQVMPFLLANQLRRNGAHISAVFNEVRPGVYKVSFRVGIKEALAGVGANYIARRTSELCGMERDMLGGGEIDRAGAIIRGTPEQIEQAIRQACREVVESAAF